MKSTERFKEAIKKYLDDRAEIDELFEKNYNKENKNIDDCIKFILNTVKKSGVNGYEDEEIYSMAIHYYDEDDIKVEKGDVNMQVVINHTVQLTDEEIAEAKEKAMRELINETKFKARSSNKKSVERKVVEKIITDDKGNKQIISESKEVKPQFEQKSLF